MAPKKTKKTKDEEKAKEPKEKELARSQQTAAGHDRSKAKRHGQEKPPVSPVTLHDDPFRPTVSDRSDIKTWGLRDCPEYNEPQNRAVQIGHTLDFEPSEFHYGGKENGLNLYTDNAFQPVYLRCIPREPFYEIVANGGKRTHVDDVYFDPQYQTKVDHLRLAKSLLEEQAQNLSKAITEHLAQLQTYRRGRWEDEKKFIITHWEDANYKHIFPKKLTQKMIDKLKEEEYGEDMARVEKISGVKPGDPWFTGRGHSTQRTINLTHKTRTGPANEKVPQRQKDITAAISKLSSRIKKLEPEKTKLEQDEEPNHKEEAKRKRKEEAEEEAEEKHKHKKLKTEKENKQSDTDASESEDKPLPETDDDEADAFEDALPEADNDFPKDVKATSIYNFVFDRHRSFIDRTSDHALKDIDLGDRQDVKTNGIDFSLPAYRGLSNSHVIDKAKADISNGHVWGKPYAALRSSAEKREGFNLATLFDREARILIQDIETWYTQAGDGITEPLPADDITVWPLPSNVKGDIEQFLGSI